MLMPAGELKSRVRAGELDLKHISVPSHTEIQYVCGKLIFSTVARFCNLAQAKAQWKIGEVAYEV